MVTESGNRTGKKIHWQEGMSDSGQKERLAREEGTSGWGGRLSEIEERVVRFEESGSSEG